MLKRRPLVSLVTNRARFHGAGTTELGTLYEQVSAAVFAGVDLIQIREADLPDRLLFDLVSYSVDMARGTGSVILVNERFDIALAAPEIAVKKSNPEIDSSIAIIRKINIITNRELIKLGSSVLTYVDGNVFFCLI